MACALGGIWCSASLLHLPKRDAPHVLAEMRRIVRPGGPLFLVMQEGDGEAWEHGAYGAPVERFFARYRRSEIEALLNTAGFRVRERLTGAAGTRRWLNLLAT